jgi:hypothetical protein
MVGFVYGPNFVKELPEERSHHFITNIYNPRPEQQCEMQCIVGNNMRQ